MPKPRGCLEDWRINWPEDSGDEKIGAHPGGLRRGERMAASKLRFLKEAFVRYCPWERSSTSAR